MTFNNEILDDPRFWAVMFAEMFGAIGERPDGAVVYPALGVSGEDARAWFEGVVGWDLGDDGAGPVGVHLPLAKGVELSVEFELGDVGWFLLADGVTEAALGSVGGHWRLPGLRVAEARAIAEGAPGASWRVTLLLLPLVWLTEGEDVGGARRAVASAWRASGLVSGAEADKLADVWVAAVRESGRYRWWESAAVGWVCDAEWSTRSEAREAGEIERINRVVRRAGGGV